MRIALLGWWVSFLAFGATDAVKKFVIEPAGSETVENGACVLRKVYVRNAEGEPVVLEREKPVEITSSSPGTELYAYFEPKCADGVKFTSYKIPEGKSGFAFYFRENLANRSPASNRNTPHTFKLTISARGVATASQDIEVRSTDCAVACRETCVNNRQVCTKACGGSQKDAETAANLRQCWRGCITTEDDCLTFCQVHDTRYPDNICPESCQEYCDARYKTCFGKCYFHADSRNTSFGAKCTDECANIRLKCRQTGCLESGL